MKKHLLGIALALAGGAFAAVKPELIPANATGVALFQVEAFVKSPFFKVIEAKAPPGAFETSGANRIGHTDIKAVTLFFNDHYLATVLEIPNKANDFINSETRYSQKKTIAGKSVLVVKEGAAFLLLNPDEALVILGIGGDFQHSEDAAAYLLDSKTPRLPAASPLTAALEAKPGQYACGIITDAGSKTGPIRRFHETLTQINQLLAADPNFKGTPAPLPEIDHLRQIAFTLSDAEAKTLRVSLALTADTTEHATQTQENFFGLKLMLGMIAKEFPALAPIHKSFTVKQKANVTEAAINLGLSDIGVLFESIVP